MSQYRVERLDLSTRIEIGMKMLESPRQRGWGWATQTASAYGISRQTLYDLRDRANEALIDAFQPQSPGPTPIGPWVQITSAYLQWAIGVLSILKGSVRDIKLGLKLLFNVTRSIGFISEILKAIGEGAEVLNQRLRPEGPIQGEVDEIFHHQQPYLTVVDGQSFLVVNLSAEADRRGKTWASTFQSLAQQGITFEDVVSDNASGIRAGLKEAGLDHLWQLDVFHLIHEGHQLTRKLENAAYRAIDHHDKVQRYTHEQASDKRRQGRPRQFVGDATESAQQEQEAIDAFEQWQWLFAEVRYALEPVHGDHLNHPEQARNNLLAAVELMGLHENAHVHTFASSLKRDMENLLVPLITLHRSVTHEYPDRSSEDEALILLVWHADDLTIQDLPEELRPMAEHYHQALTQLHRASSHVESFHSWLRPYLAIHRTLPDWLLPLLTLVWNHHTFQRGKRAGHSPVELAGCEDILSLEEVLRLVCQMAFGDVSQSLAA